MDSYEELREEMVVKQLVQRGIKDRQVLDAFRNVPRHLFVPQQDRKFAYEDRPLSIGNNQTISQPYMVALMTEVLEVNKGMKVLEIGTGSGYQAAILYYLGGQVYTVERIGSLAQGAKEVWDDLGYDVKVNVGDGSIGLKEYAPYDRIIVTAASPSISPLWLEQLNETAKIVLPLGETFHQDLVVAEKTSAGKITQRVICGCIFVPFIGKYGYGER